MDLLNKAVKEASKIGDKVQKHASDIQQGATFLAQDMLKGSEKAATVELLFAEGPLGFALEGTRVAAVEADEQAERLGVRPGDRLLAMGGFSLPAPPQGEDEEQLERHNQMIKKWLVQMPRPGYLRFEKAAPPPPPAADASHGAGAAAAEASASALGALGGGWGADDAAAVGAGAGSAFADDAALSDTGAEVGIPNELGLHETAAEAGQGQSALAEGSKDAKAVAESHGEKERIADLQQQLTAMRAKYKEAHSNLSRSDAEGRRLAAECKAVVEELQGARKAFAAREAGMEAELARLRGALGQAEARSRSMVEAAEQATAAAEAGVAELQAIASVREKEMERLAERAAEAEAKVEAVTEELRQVQDSDVARLSEARDRAIEHEQRATIELRKAREELAEMKRAAAAAEEANKEKAIGAAGPEPEGVEEDAPAAAASPPPREEGSASVMGGVERLAYERAHERIVQLEKRCIALQKRLDTRPIIFQAPPSGPIGGGGAICWEPLARRLCGPHVSASLVRLYGLPDRALRKFTHRLLKQDAWLWVFYAHLLFLYAIAASCYAKTTPDSGNPMEMMNRQVRQEATLTP